MPFPLLVFPAAACPFACHSAAQRRNLLSLSLAVILSEAQNLRIAPLPVPLLVIPQHSEGTRFFSSPTPTSDHHPPRILHEKKFLRFPQQNRVSSPPDLQNIEIANKDAPFVISFSWPFPPAKLVQFK